MKICFPVERIEGLGSPIAANFKAAPALLFVDSDTCANYGVEVGGSACGALPDDLDVVVYADGIGRGLFNGLRMHGIGVFRTDAATVGVALAGFVAGDLEAVGEVACCGGGQHAQANEAAHSCACGGHGESHDGGRGCGCGGHEAGHGGGHGCGCGGH